MTVNNQVNISSDLFNVYMYIKSHFPQKWDPDAYFETYLFSIPRDLNSSVCFHCNRHIARVWLVFKEKNMIQIGVWTSHFSSKVPRDYLQRRADRCSHNY